MASAGSNCRLSPSGNGINHVIYLQFDNVHFTRDNPNVPSDLEQMPNLLNFLTHNGVLDADHHTPLIAHTGTDILTSLTGVYGDRMGQPVSNSYRYFTPAGTSNPAVTFAYWTDGVFDPTTDGSTPIVDSAGRPGFPGFDGMSAANTLGYVAQMQEAGVPVTFGYISDAHDRHPSGGAYGPGEAGYVAALKSYDNAFGAFFQRLGRDGITPANTLFG